MFLWNMPSVLRHFSSGVRSKRIDWGQLREITHKNQELGILIGFLIDFQTSFIAYFPIYFGVQNDVSKMHCIA